MSSRRQSLSLPAILLALAAAGACNAILGIEAGELVEGDGGLSGSDASMEGGPESGGMGGGGGGSAGSGGATGGGAGSGGRGGSGGGSGGASGATGGMSGTGGSIGVPGSVICGETECGTQSSGCCILPASSGTMPECIENVGAACPDGVPATCDGPSDCATGESCCVFIDLITGSVTIECATACTETPNTAAAVVECLGARNCPGTQSCCTTMDGFLCGDTCPQALCQGADDCRGGEPCVPSNDSLPSCGGLQGGSVQCGGQICDTTQNLRCCADASGMGTTCQIMCPASTVSLACDGHEDCPSSMCCGSLDPVAMVLFGTSCSAVGTSACGAASFPLACNGQHNCPPGTNCCFIDNNSGSACLPEPCAQPGYPQLCATNAECSNGMACMAMTSPTGNPFGLRACR